MANNIEPEHSRVRNNRKLITIAGIVVVIAAIAGLYILDAQKQTLVITRTGDKSLSIIQDTGVELNDKTPIKVGVLHSLSGTMAISETSVVDATLLAIEEINDRGGVLGRKIQPIIRDGSSDWPTFAKEAERLIIEDDVSAIFGGWTSASRKTMKPIFEKYDHLLFYPVQYEGLEQSPNIVYTGAAPNQQVLPAVDWAFENLGTKFFLVGSDYVFPRSANEIMKHRINELGGEILGEEYRILGDDDFVEVVNKIIETEPDVILNTINGDSNVSFFRELRENGINPRSIPTISFSIAEDEIRHLGAENMKGDYAAWNYFQNLDTANNKAFVTNFKNKFGEHRVTDDPMEAAYIGVYIFAQAVETVGTDNVKTVREAVKGLTFSAPEGIVGVDPENQHLTKVVRIGQILESGQFDIVASSEEPIKPIPYPKYKSKEEWHAFLDDLYYGWGEQWSKPVLDT
jgi:urea transport system substrate-binding protein